MNSIWIWHVWGWLIRSPLKGLTSKTWIWHVWGWLISSPIERANLEDLKMTCLPSTCACLVPCICKSCECIFDFTHIYVQIAWHFLCGRHGGGRSLLFKSYLSTAPKQAYITSPLMCFADGCQADTEQWARNGWGVIGWSVVYVTRLKEALLRCHFFMNHNKPSFC